MFTINGKHNTATVFTDIIESEAIAQIQTLCNQDAYADSKICIMPDVHAGAGCTIGTTMTINGKATPNLVGVDIGCGMKVVKLKEKELDLAKLDKVVTEHIPSGFDIRTKVHPNISRVPLSELRCSARSKSTSC